LRRIFPVSGPVTWLTILEEAFYLHLSRILRYSVTFLDQHRQIPSVAVELD
jgi:hypothetical protein